jgi:D-alanyl-D-alanine carboxypeptidase
MFSFLVALTMFLTFSPVKPEVKVADFHPPRHAALPLAGNAPEQSVPVKKDVNRLGVVTTASSAYVADWKTGAVLFEKNADVPQPIASITKLMTAMVVLGTNPDWGKQVAVLPGDEPPGGVSYLIPGETVTVRDLFNLSLVASSNGATVALARSSGLSEEDFAKRMNETAASIGMTDSSFVEPVGLNSGDSASARDVSRLVRTALSHQEIHDAVVQKEYHLTTKSGAQRTVRSTDELLGSFLDKPPYAFLGGKTGFIQEAGYCFGAAAQNADGNGVVAVVLGADSKELRFKEVKSLMYWAFDAYSWPERLASAQ